MKHKGGQGSLHQGQPFVQACRGILLEKRS